MAATASARPPAWVQDAVFYAVIPDRCGSGGEVPEFVAPDAFEPWDARPAARAYKGGTLWGVVERLDDLADLGIGALYLTPVFSASSFHGYKTISHYEIEPLLGGDAAFDALCVAAHARGIRVVLDGVFNHVDLAFPRFRNVLENGAASPWRDWFRIDAFPLNPWDEARPSHYACWEGRRTMPELNADNPAVREYVSRVCEHWVRKGADGWRFDCPTKVGDAAFWRQLRGRLKAIDPEVYLLGEVWTDSSPWLDGTQWDAATNYPLMFTILRFVAGERLRYREIVANAAPQAALDAAQFAAELARLHARTAWPFVLAQFNFVNTPDTGRVRTLVDADGAIERLAAVLLFTLPGAPCLLYAQEVGASGGAPPESRIGFPPPGAWDRSLREFYRALIGLRRRHEAFRSGGFRVIGTRERCVSFARETARQRIVVVVNAGTEPVSVGPDVAVDHVLFGAEHVRAPDGGTIAVAASGFVVVAA